MTVKETENIIEIKPIIKDEIPAANSPLLSLLIGAGFVWLGARNKDKWSFH
jgi:hypothetical protein